MALLKHDFTATISAEDHEDRADLRPPPHNRDMPSAPPRLHPYRH